MDELETETERLTEGRFRSTSEYFRYLVREDQKRRTNERLETLLLEGLVSGEPVDVTDKYIQKKRADLRQGMGLRGYEPSPRSGECGEERAK